MDIENEEFLLFLKCASINKLRYLCIGGYAVNYYGFHRHTEDLDIWIAPTNENKDCFFNTLSCMGYSEQELVPIKDQNFTQHFVCSLSYPPYVIDVLTIIHKDLNFEDAEKDTVIHIVSEGIELKLIPYHFLKEVKLRSGREKDYFDIARLEEMRNQKQIYKMNYQTLLPSLENNILTITINRPDKLNAINYLLMDELSLIIDEVYANTSVRSAIITGAGNKAFVAGADISEFLGKSGEGMALAKRGQDIFFKIENSPKPIIAAVNGFALGGGCELAMACHFRIASENAKFGQPEINLGLIPGYGGTQRLTQLIGKGRSMELLMTGNMIDAATALQYGLVNYVTTAEELLNKSRALLDQINAKAPIALAQCIHAVNAGFDHSKNGYDVEAIGFGDCFKTEDMKEGTLAFLEKRKPVFIGK